MVRFDTQQIRREAAQDYEKTWIATARLLEASRPGYELVPKGRSHPLFDLILRIRSVLLELGFEEVILSSIIEDTEVIRQYGPEGNIILDRVFYLAGLPRPDIGISKDAIDQITRIVPGFTNVEKLQAIFRAYKRGEIEADDLLETLVLRLAVTEAGAAQILGLFPEFQQMKPVASSLTLRSHTTAAWFPAIREIMKRQALPLQLFSIGQKYRREQRVDATHLLESWTASIAIMAEDLSMDAVQHAVTRLFERLGYTQVQFTMKAATSKYYAPQTEFEAFIRQSTSGEFLEVGDGGFYSPVSLAQYEIPYPVFNFGFGLERLVMIEHNIPDIRQVVYPYLYSTIQLTDHDIAQSLTFTHQPRKLGELIPTMMEKTRQHCRDPSPCEVLLYDGPVGQKHLRIVLTEREAGQRLLGAAAFNPIVVHQNAIIGARSDRVPEDAVVTGLTYMTGIFNRVLYDVEHALQDDTSELQVRVTMVKRLADINLKVSEHIRRYIEGQNAKIDVRGPVFAEFQIHITD
ncbi:MAG: O-phosphoserine--tRNA ligase [Candidatus Bathyarchaeota archaeon]|nr:O-phosphoserine--tRNA ligase [Candidatus Bathyarchaeota archaeon]